MKLRNVLVMLVLAALCALAFYALWDVAPTSGTKLPNQVAEFVKDEVKKVTVQSEGKTLTLLRRTDRSDAWEVSVAMSSVRADGVAVDELLGQLARQEVKAKFERAKLNDADLRGYGLDAPQGVVEIETPKGPLVFRLGKRTREGAGTYLDTGPQTDVWVVGGGVLSQVASMAASGARSKRFTDLRLFDVGKVEIVKGGVTTLEVARDPSQIWKFTQPFKGYADPPEMERMLDRLVTTELTDWAEVGAQDLKPYGLDAPRAEVRLTHKKGGEPVVLLVGSASDAGVFVMEKGRPNVALVPKRFADAVDTDPLTLRDRSFTRIGNDGVALRVKIGEMAYELAKEGSSWDVTKPDRFPGDDTAVRDALELIRSWRTSEFDDRSKPADFGISETSDSIEVERQGGGKVTLRLGKEAGADGTRWAQRIDADGEGGLERVDGAPIERLAKGYAQFRRKLVRDYEPFLRDLERISRDAGTSEEGKAVQTLVLERDVTAERAEWKPSGTLGPGLVGKIDPDGVNALYSLLQRIVAREWLFWDESKNAEMGFNPPKAETLTLTLKFNTRTATPPDGAEQVLMIGKKREDGGYYARFFGDKGGWAFVLAPEDVQKLMATLVK
jgi:hypothetical protein